MQLLESDEDLMDKFVTVAKFDAVVVSNSDISDFDTFVEVFKSQIKILIVFRMQRVFLDIRGIALQDFDSGSGSDLVDISGEFYLGSVVIKNGEIRIKSSFLVLCIAALSFTHELVLDYKKSKENIIQLWQDIESILNPMESSIITEELSYRPISQDIMIREIESLLQDPKFREKILSVQ